MLTRGVALPLCVSQALVFEPSSVTISKGDTVTWTNNAGFPHNIVFDEDAVPAGVNADALSNEDYLNAPGETVTRKFDVAGEYNYYCEPHQGAGMQGKVCLLVGLWWELISFSWTRFLTFIRVSVLIAGYRQLNVAR